MAADASAFSPDRPGAAQGPEPAAASRAGDDRSAESGADAGTRSGVDRNSLAAVIEDLRRRAENADEVSLGDLSGALGSRGHGPLFAVPALIQLSPLGGIPGVPTLLALFIAVFAVQLLSGREGISFPRFLKRRAVDADRAESALDRIAPWAEKIDAWFGGRLERLTDDPAPRAAAAAVLALCLIVPPLELAPFAAAAPMAAIALFGLALTLRDGALMLLGWAFAAGAVATLAGIV